MVSSSRGFKVTWVWPLSSTVAEGSCLPRTAWGPAVTRCVSSALTLSLIGLSYFWPYLRGLHTPEPDAVHSFRQHGASWGTTPRLQEQQGYAGGDVTQGLANVSAEIRVELPLGKEEKRTNTRASHLFQPRAPLGPGHDAEAPSKPWRKAPRG